MRSRVIVFLLVLTAAVFGSCDSGDAVYEIMVGDARFQVEVAQEQETRARGLMFRESLEERHGMLFVFPDETLRSFYMKNTLIPLSIAYIDSRLVIREIYDMTPLVLTPVPSRFPAMYALEVKQGDFEAAGVRVGDRLELPTALLNRLEVD